MQNAKILNLLLNTNFRRLWLGTILAYLGDTVTQVALIAWIISSMPKAGSAMAMIIFFFTLPSLLLSPVAGAWTDRFPRKELMAWSSIYRAVITLGLICFIHNSSSSAQTLSYVFSGLLGVGFAFFYPPKQSIIPNIVKSNQLQTANAINAATTTITVLLGAIIAGSAIAQVGLMKCLIGTAGAYILASMLIYNINEAKTPTNKHTDIINDFKTAVSYLNTHKKTFNLILLAISISLITASFFHSMNALAIDYYKIGIAGLSKLKGMLGAGMIVGTLATIYLSKYIRPVYLLALSFMVIVATTATANFATTYTLVWYWLIATGIANAAINITLDTMLQKATPDRFMGKVFGFRSTVTTLAFLASTWLVSQALNITSPLDIFRVVSWISLGIALMILFFDRTFSFFVLRTSVNALFRAIYPIKVEGRQYLLDKGRVIIAGNHTGWFDTLILTSAIQRPVWFIAGPMVYHIPIVKWLVPYLNIISLNYGKGVKALDEAVKYLDKGEVVLIFPEGKLSKDGDIDKFQRGVGYLHKSSKAPVVPFAIKGGFEAWAWNKLPKWSKITIQFGQSVNMPDAHDKVIADELEKRVSFMKDALERRAKGEYNNDDILSIMQMSGDVNATIKALCLKEKDGTWKEMSYIELSRQAKNFANYLISLGIQREERLAILSESRPEWAVAFFASIQTGTITVPLDIKLTLSELTSILSDCNPRVICVSEHYLNMAEQIRAAVPSIEHIFVLEQVKDLKGPEGDMGRQRDLDETALIVYTSGTTGNPKGVMTTFRNIISQLRDVEKLFNMDSSDSLISILPLNHLLELNMGLLSIMYRGAQVSYSKSLSPKEISSVMKEKRVTYMITVPLFVKMLKSSIEKEIKKSGAESAFNLLYKIAGYIPNVAIRRMMFGKIHAGFGGRMKGFMCGGAPLDMDVAEFFDRVGIPVYQGYGLTETSPTLATNYPKNNRLGSVGKAIPSVTLKLADTCEILALGPNIMKGYYGKPEMTREVIDGDGWFHTGDIGEFDKDGYLYITGRIKNMIVLGGGKKIFPEEVEAVLEKSDLIKELCVLSVKIQSGNKAGTEEVGVVIVPADNLQNKPDDELQKLLEAEVKTLGKDLAPYKQPSAIIIHREELPKTATRKVKRKLVQEWAEGKATVSA